RRSLHTVGAVAQVDVVQVQLQDLVLRELPLDLPGYTSLHDLPADAPLGVREPFREEVSGELLRDGAAAFRHATRAYVTHHRPEQPTEIHPAVVVEAAVLDGDEGVRKMWRQRIDRHDPAVHRGESGERLSRH